MGNGKGWALVTGASGGLGLELAKELAADGFDLILIARRQAELEALAASVEKAHGTQARVIVCDLSDAAAPARIHHEVASAGLTVEVLVNNAGFGVYGPVLDNDLQRQLALVQVNVAAAMALCHLFGSEMRARGRGRILNVASLASFTPVPKLNAYAASKAFLRSFSEALNQELKGSGVTVTCLCPGAVHTGFEEAASMEGVMLFRVLVADAAATARAGLKALMAGRAVLVSGWNNKVTRWLVPFLPRPVVFAVGRMLMARR